MGINMLTVSQLNRYVKSLFDDNKLLRELYIKGEISNFVDHYRTGHMYFTLKDNNASIKCVMFSSSAKFLRFKPENGMSVIVGGSVSIYEKDGTYQLYVTDMQPDGIGALAIAYEQLKMKLSDEGLFDADLKQQIPRMPKTIGIVTARDAAALSDILNILSRRYPIGKVRLYPVTVQGKNAAPSIVKALKQINNEEICDVIILARGGGSIEDLWAFNEEVVVRAVSACNIPIISAVGHETDYTLCDFVSDLRAATPSEGAELVAIDIGRIKENMSVKYTALKNTATGFIYEKKSQLNISASQLLKSFPKRFIEEKTYELLNKEKHLRQVVNGIINTKSTYFSSRCAVISSLSPLGVIARGYTITKTDNGNFLSKVEKGDIIITTTMSSLIKSKITDIKPIN